MKHRIEKPDGTIITINIRIRHFVAQREDGTPYGYGIVLDIPNRERQIDFTIISKEGFRTKKVNTLEDILDIKGVVRFQWQKNKYLLTSANTINKDGIYVELTPKFEIPDGLTKSEQLIYEILKMNEGKTIRKETLAQLTSAIINPSSFQSHISRLRKKIEPLGEQIKYKNNAYRLTKKLEIEKYNCQ